MTIWHLLQIATYVPLFLLIFGIFFDMGRLALTALAILFIGYVASIFVERDYPGYRTHYCLEYKCTVG